MADAMPSRFGWIGATRRAQLRERIAACARAWLEDWHVAHDDTSACVDDAPIVPYSPDEAVVLQAGVHAGADTPCHMVAVARDEMGRLGGWLADIREGGALLAQDVGRAALEDLARRIDLLAGKGEVVEHGASAWPQGLTREELGAVGLTIDVGGATVNLALSRAMVDTLCPPGAAAATHALQPRTEGAESLTVTLTAGFEFGAISMRELAGLCIGEVLVGECPLDTPIQLKAPGQIPVGNARMGRVGNRLAVALTNHPTLQETP